jgi:hypothetical protein
MINLTKSRKTIIIGVVVAFFATVGCAETFAVLDILYPTPTPVCDWDSCGIVFNGKVYVKYSDGIYRWKDLE